MPIRSLFEWLDSDRSYRPKTMPCEQRIETVELSKELPRCEWDRFLPFAFLHAGCLALPLVGVSWTAVVTAAALYLVRMFAITGFYHRYFSHRSFKTGRAVQFIFAVLGCAAVQRGPLWWAAHHRHHHKYADQDIDIHSPRRSFFWSHMGWLTSSTNMRTSYERIQDFACYPELVLLNRFDWFVPLLLAGGLFLMGSWLSQAAPTLGTSGPQLLVWGFFISTTCLFHATCSINSMAHIFGSRRYETEDDSRNNLWLALITLGEGWHNNHHRFSSSCRQGFFWWELDLTFYMLYLMRKLGLITDIKPVPELAYREAAAGGRRSAPLVSGRTEQGELG